MAYALIVNGSIVAVRNPGRLEAKLSDGKQLGPPDTGWTPELAALCGFVPITETARPADTATDTTDRTVQLVNGIPTVVWVTRAKNAVELESASRSTIDVDLRTKARAALTANQTFLALASPTNAQTLAQVRRLTRECSGLIRLLIGGDLLVTNADT